MTTLDLLEVPDLHTVPYISAVEVLHDVLGWVVSANVMLYAEKSPQRGV